MHDYRSFLFDTLSLKVAGFVCPSVTVRLTLTKGHKKSIVNLWDAREFCRMSSISSPAIAPDNDTAPARISQPQHIVAQNSNFLTIVKPELLLLMMQVVGKICRATAKLKTFVIKRLELHFSGCDERAAELGYFWHFSGEARGVYRDGACQHSKPRHKTSHAELVTKIAKRSIQKNVATKFLEIILQLRLLTFIKQLGVVTIHRKI